MLGGRFFFEMLTDQEPDRGHNGRQHSQVSGYFTLPRVDEDTKQKLLNGT